MATYYAVGSGAVTMFVGVDMKEITWDFLVDDKQNIIYSDRGFLRSLDPLDGVCGLVNVLEDHWLIDMSQRNYDEICRLEGE